MYLQVKVQYDGDGEKNGVSGKRERAGKFSESGTDIAFLKEIYTMLTMCVYLFKTFQSTVVFGFPSVSLSLY